MLYVIKWYDSSIYIFDIWQVLHMMDNGLFINKNGIINIKYLKEDSDSMMRNDMQK